MRVAGLLALFKVGQLLCAGAPASRPDRRGFNRHARGAYRQPGLQCQVLRGIDPKRLGPHAHHAAAQPALQAAQALPFQPVAGVAGGVRLGDAGATQALAGMLVVALGAGQVELAQPLLPQRLALGAGGAGTDPGADRRTLGVFCPGEASAEPLLPGHLVTRGETAPDRYRTGRGGRRVRSRRSRARS